MNYNTFEQTVEQIQESRELDANSLYRAMQQVQDGRKKRVYWLLGASVRKKPP